MIQIRQATEQDIDILFDMILEIARYHNQEQYVVTTKEALLRAAFSNDAKFGALISTYDGVTAGYVSFTYNYSIWLGISYMNIDDLFVKEAFRGKKIGEALMHEIKTRCNTEGIQRVKWEVEKGNTAAIRFYERLGANVSIKGLASWDLS